MASHDSPKTLRGEGKKIDESKVAANLKSYDLAPYPAPGHSKLPASSIG